MFELDKKADEVAAFYAKEMEAQGWKKTSSMEIQGTRMMGYEKENRQASVTVAENAETKKTALTLTVSKSN
jgi:hypothetical protein